MLCRIGIAIGLPPSGVRRLPASDVALLTAFYQEEPWGRYESRLQDAMIASAMFNLNRGPNPERSAQDFMLAVRPDYDAGIDPPQVVEEQKRILDWVRNRARPYDRSGKAGRKARGADRAVSGATRTG